jgi:spore coat protein CotH
VFLVALTALFVVSCTVTTTTIITSFSTTTTSSGQTTTTSTTNSTGVDATYDALFDNTNFKRFTIRFSLANFNKLIEDMENYFDAFGSYRDNTIQEVDILYEDGRGASIELYEVGFRTKGNIFSRVLPIVRNQQGQVVGYQQVSFQLEFNETFRYPEASTQYKELKNRKMFDLEQLNFKFIRTFDTTAITELIALDFYREIGLVASNSSLAIIYFDLEGTIIPYGLFSVIEAIDDEFVKRYFGKDEFGSLGDLYKCVWQNFGPADLKNNLNPDEIGVSDYMAGYRMTYQLRTNKNKSDHSIFKTFLQKLNAKTVPNYASVLSQIIDMDSWLKALAMGFLIGNPDDYRSDANNYYLYFYPLSDGLYQAVYIPFDNDQALGVGWNPFGNYGIDLNVWNYQPAQQAIGSSSDLPLAYNVLQIASYRTQYEDYLLAYTDPQTGVFTYQRFYDEYVIARDLYEYELQLMNHLGLKTFSLTARNLPAQQYFAQKIQNVRTQIANARS